MATLCKEETEEAIKMSTRRTARKGIQGTGTHQTASSLRRSSRFAEKAKPSQAVLAAKRNARLKHGTKKAPEIVVRDIYHVAREAKNLVKGDTGIVYDPSMAEHKCLWDPNYPECPERFTSVLQRCIALGLVSRCTFIQPRKATETEILKMHSSKHLKILKETSNCIDENFLEKLSSRYDAIYIHPSTYELSLLAAGSAIELVDSICSGKIQNGMAIVRPPGHHAMSSEYCGYCFFNNVALAATHALMHYGISKILIVDWDVHHGQATQQMFYSDPRVVYFSIHRYEHGSFWPNLRESDYHYIGDGPGTGYNFNIPLNSTGMNDSDYLAIFHQVLLPMAAEFQPELILVSAGYDAAIGCPEGEMEVTPACYAHLLNSLMAFAGGKVAVVLEGGYCLQSLAEGAALTLRALLGDPCPVLPNTDAPCEGIQETILNVIYSHKDFWQCYQFQNEYSIKDTCSDVKIAERRHLPTVKFLGSDERPETYETRNCYPVQSEEFLKSVALRLSNLIGNTRLTFPPHRVSFVYDEQMLKHRNLADPGHPEKPERISAIYNRHEEFGLLKRCHRIKARAATEEELLLLHAKEYIELMKDLAKKKPVELAKLQDDYRSVYFHSFSYQSACLAAGCVLQLVDSVLGGESRSGIAIVRPPGHHAEDDESCGFCLFNNISLAAKYAIEFHGIKRILLVDWDVHHGNGTQHLFEDDPRVLYISLHRYDNGSFFPSSTDANYNVVGDGKGEGYNINIPWNKAGIGDAEYIAAFFQIVLPVAYQYNPELVLISAGFDACVGDPLGGCKVTPEAYGHLTHYLTSLANGRIILSLEGGYNITTISYAMPMCTKALLGDPMPSLTPRLVPCTSAVNTICSVIRTHSRFWSSLCFQVALPCEQVIMLPHKTENQMPPSEDIPHVVNIQENVTVTKPQQVPDNISSLPLGESLLKLTLDNQATPESPVRTLDISPSSLSTELELSSSSSFKESSPDDVPLSSIQSVPTPKSPDAGYSDDGYRSEELLNTPASSSPVSPEDIKFSKAADNPAPSSGSGCGTNGTSEENSNAAAGSAQSSSNTQGQQTLSDYLAENIQLLLEEHMYAVIPLSDCPHLESLQEVPEEGLNCTAPCQECGSTAENWVCLVCYTVHCGRYIAGHMMQHGLDTSHPLTLSFSDLSVWCYGCETYVDNEVLYPARNALHRSKFGEDMPWSYGERS